MVIKRKNIVVTMLKKWKALDRTEKVELLKKNAFDVGVGTSTVSDSKK